VDQQLREIVNQDLMFLRNNDDFYVTFARTNLIERLLYISLPKLWNEFQDDVLKSEANKIVFNAKLKGHFIGQLNANYVCTRLLCPHCHLNNEVAFNNNDNID
jgi:hypothetical protein